MIIDTSDRVCPEKHPDQREKDIGILKKIVDQFYELIEPEIRTGKIKKHKLNFVVPDQPETQNPPYNITEKLTLTAPEKRSGNPEFQNKKQELIDAVSELYDYVQKHPQTGSDIWDWFRSQAEHSFSKSHQNLVVCLSDGYLTFDKQVNRPKGTCMWVREFDDLEVDEAINKIKNGKSLHPVGNFKDFNVKFLMLEIRLRETNGVKHFQDFDIIQAYWKTWLDEMGIEDTQFFEQLDPGGLKNKIESFIQLK